MARTLQQLKEKIERLIEQQGEDAPVAAFIFTNEDVCTVDEETLEEQYYPIEVCEQVLDELEGYDYIYEQVFECIEDDLRRILRK